MRKKITHILAVVATSYIMIACNEEIETFDGNSNETIDNEVQPGSEYTKQGDACLNVFYAIPSNLDTVTDWHRRLSGTTLFVQEFYKKNFIKLGYSEKTFNLEVNNVNPNYIRIHYLPLDLTTKIEQKNMINHATEKAIEYYKEHNLSSKNSLIYMPEYPSSDASKAPLNGNFDKSSPESVIDDMGFGVLAVDHPDFDIKHVGKPAHSMLIDHLSSVIHELGHGFWIQHHENGMDAERGVMGYAIRTFLISNPDSLSFSKCDILRMNELSVFNKNSSGDSFNFNPWDNEIGINGNDKATVEYDNNNNDIVINWKFKSTKKVVGFIAYVDPWLAPDVADDHLSIDQITDYDAITYLASTEEITAIENDYTINMRIKWADFLSKDESYNNIKHGEVRFRIIFEGGSSLPASGIDENKGPLPTSLSNRTLVRFHFTIANKLPVFDNDTYPWK